jgi:hypothetical protein
MADGSQCSEHGAAEWVIGAGIRFTLNRDGYAVGLKSGGKLGGIIILPE